MRIINLILDLIYPPTCISCHKILNTFSTERYLCSDCIKQYNFFDISGCKICGRDTKEELCDICSKFEISHFNRNYSLFKYDGEYKSFIFKLKYGLNKKYSYAMSLLMYKYIVKNNLFNNIDIITCVPMHKTKQRKRGFNQSELLAKQLSKYLNVPYKNTIVRNKNTVPQSKLNFNDRFKNLNTVFQPIDNVNINIKGKNVLIIDDIYTSGATIMKCSKVLKQLHANEIYSLTFTIAH